LGSKMANSSPPHLAITSSFLHFTQGVNYTL
jgi:hypothetical protein